QMYQLRRYGTYYDFKWLEERLKALGFHLIFCTRTPDSFTAARAKRLKVSGNPEQYDDLQLFIDEQDLLRALVAKSLLPTLVLDISDDDVAGAVERIADWLEQTGGLYMSS
ncbi:MAG TPA: hypothetical protein PLG50_13745, partial [bacterium]|nr:hypothetical protein [bacterium]